MSNRRLEILRAIVDEYVATQEPVGSKAIADRHGLGISPATIRNEMAVLEEEGLIAQPHTSAGRIPTDAGYRLFVDRIETVKPLSGAERRAIETFLDEANNLEQLMGQIKTQQYEVRIKNKILIYCSLMFNHMFSIKTQKYF